MEENLLAANLNFIADFVEPEPNLDDNEDNELDENDIERQIDQDNAPLDFEATNTEEQNQIQVLEFFKIIFKTIFIA